ncbi:MAG: hypothetical protein U0176_01355 [Bacteroidia bacterium]
MRNTIFLGLLLTLSLIVFGCHTDHGSGGGITVDSTQADGDVKFCGKPELVDVQGDKGWPVGTFEIQNDSQYLWITFAPISVKPTANISIYVGDPEACPKLATGKMNYTAFPIQVTNHSLVMPWAVRVPLTQLKECVVVAGRFEVKSEDAVGVGELGMDKATGTAQGLRYCIQSCAASSQACDLADSTKRPKTIRQEAWLSEGDSGAQEWLQSNFGKLYPDGLVLGCEHTLTIGSAAEVTNSLPMDGPATSLAATAKGLQRQGKGNQLLGELICLELAVKMNESSKGGESPRLALGQLVVGSGAFEGWTLDELRHEANSVLGACTSNFTATQIAEVLHAVNASLAQGQDPGDLIRCPSL